MIEPAKSQYAQIADLLRKRIEDGTYPPGGTLPSEDKLAQELGVSRVTVNQAVKLLRTSGDVKVRRGQGTTIRSIPRITRNAVARYAARDRGTGAAEVEIEALGHTSRTEYRHIGPVVPPAEVAKALGLGAKSKALLRSRALFANDEPTQLADSYIPWSIAEGSADLRKENAGRGGSYGRLADLGFAPKRFTEEITVRTPTDAEARMLVLEQNQPVYQIWHMAYTAAGDAVEVCVHVMSGHLWKLRYEWTENA